MSLPDADFLDRLTDIADGETMPRCRVEIAIDARPKAGYTFDPVTEADRQAEIALRAEILEYFPEHAILGEELGLTGNGRHR